MAGDYEAIIKAAREVGEVRDAGGDGRFMVVPEGGELVDLEVYLDRPSRKRARVEAHSAKAFAAYFNRHRSEGSVIFADESSFEVIGILDHHEPHREGDEVNWGAGHGAHRVTYVAPRSPEWVIWTAASGKLGSQDGFAHFIEDNAVDIRQVALADGEDSPMSASAADMIEVARTFEVRSRVEFQSAVRLDSGMRQFSYHEAGEASSAKGIIKVPEEFRIGIPVFDGGESYEVRVKLRWRLDAGRLSIGYELHRPGAIERDAFTAVAGEIAAATATPVWLGSPG